MQRLLPLRPSHFYPSFSSLFIFNPLVLLTFLFLPLFWLILYRSCCYRRLFVFFLFLPTFPLCPLTARLFHLAFHLFNLTFLPFLLAFCPIPSRLSKYLMFVLIRNIHCTEIPIYRKYSGNSLQKKTLSLTHISRVCFLCSCRFAWLSVIFMYYILHYEYLENYVFRSFTV